MSTQPAEEWSEMSQHEQDQIKARLIEACDTRADVLAHIVRERLERASRSGLAKALAPHGI